MNTQYTVVVKVDAGGAIENLGEIQQTVEKSNSNLIALRKELKSVQSELLGLEPGTKEFDQLAKRAGDLKDRMNDVGEAVRANAGPALESIGNQAGLLKDRFLNLDLKGVGEAFTGIAGSIKKVSFKDLTDGVAGFGKGIASVGKALLTNPIFLIGAAIALVATNLDKVAKLIDGVSSESENLLKVQQEAAATSKEQLDNISAQENILRLQGKSEKEILQLKQQAVKVAIEDQKLAIQTNKTILQGQVDAAKRNKDILEGVFKFITAPLQAILMLVDKVAGTTLQDDLNNFVATAVFDPTEIEKEGQAAIKAQEDALKALENQQDGFQLSVNKINQDAANEREKLRVEEREREKKLLADILKLRQQTTQLITQDRKKEEADRKAAELAAKKEITDIELKAIEDQKALRLQLFQSEQDQEIAAVDEKFKKMRELAGTNSVLLTEIAAQNAKAVEEIDAKYRSKKQREDAALRDAQLNIASQVISGLQSLTDSFQAKNEKQAKIQFNISKALGIAEATINAFKGVNQALASPPGPPTSIITAAAIGAAGIANVLKISRTKYGGGASGAPSVGGASGSSGGGGSVGAPSFNPLNTQFFNNQPMQPISAYVLAGSAQDENERREKIENLARLN